MDTAVDGYRSNSFWGSVKAEFANGLTALADTFGGRAVKALSTASGTAAGCGQTGKAVALGTATVGLIALEAFSWGRAGAMIGAPMKGVKALGTDYSHFIGESTMRRYPIWKRIFSPERTVFNGRVVPVLEHAATDFYRFNFLPKAMKQALGGKTWGPVRSYLNRTPDWGRFFMTQPGTRFIDRRVGG